MKPDLKDLVFIIDGSSFLYRAYYSIRPLTTKAGEPVNAVYGFCRMIKKLIDTYSPEYMVLVWDSKGKTVRHELYQEYKHTRQAAPSDLISQKILIQEFADLLGLTQLQVEGVEADDLMYSVASSLQQENYKSMFVTSDKDMGQALSEHITILDPFKEAFITKASLEEKMGFSINKLPFYYALVGDSSDNIPGVKGIGPKGAQQLVMQFASLKDLYSNLDKISSERIRELLKVSQDNAFLSEQLFLLRFYDTYLTRESCSFKPDSWAQARPLFERLEFKSLLAALEPGQEQKLQEPEITLSSRYKFILVDTVEELNVVCNEIKQHGHFALDTEGTSLKPLEGELVGLSICTAVGIAYYIPCGHKTSEKQLDKETVLKYLKPYLEDQTIKKYLHHAKFDALMLHAQGIELAGIVFDTMIAASLLVADGQRIGLKYLSQYYLEEPMLLWADVVKKNKYPDFSYVPLGLATEYAAADAHQTMRLYTIFGQALEQQGLKELFDTVEMPLNDLLYKMECAGICVHQDVLTQIDTIVSHEIMRLRNEIIDLIGPERADINLNSPKQLEDLLFNYLQLPAVKKTVAKTSYSTDQEVLAVLAKIHPVPALIIRYRELFKLKSTYIDALSQCISSKTGRVHTSFNQTAVATGRLASSEPNLQNIPVNAYNIRSAFKASEGNVFISADYSQIELRVLAYLSQDETLITAFNNNQDIHALTASTLFSVPLDQVTSEQRQVGKRINFSILYGLTPHGLAKDLQISHKLAQEYIHKYMAQYPGVSAWMETVVAKTKEKGYVETHWGRRRYMPGIYEKNKSLYELARRVAINTVAQGTAAELMKMGMINLDKALAQQNLSGKMLLQIHDELLLEVPRAEADITQALVKNSLQTVVNWNVPLIATTRIGKDWQEVTK